MAMTAPSEPYQSHTAQDPEPYESHVIQQPYVQQTSADEYREHLRQQRAHAAERDEGMTKGPRRVNEDAHPQVHNALWGSRPPPQQEDHDPDKF